MRMSVITVKLLVTVSMFVINPVSVLASVTYCQGVSKPCRTEALLFCPLQGTRSNDKKLILHHYSIPQHMRKVNCLQIQFIQHRGQATEWMTRELGLIF